MSPAKKLGLLSSLYFSQGLPYGFFVTALPTLLREQGVSLTTISLANLLALPWALKFLWAPAIDRLESRRLGWRRGWILPLQALAALTLAGLGLLDFKTELVPVLALVCLTNLLAATQDVATDGLAVGLLSHAERGLGNGVQVGAYRVGMIVGGGVVLMVIGTFGWTATLVALAALLALASVPILLHREPLRPPSPAPAEPLLAGIVADAVDMLTRPAMVPWLLLLVLYKCGDAIAGGMINPFFVDVGLTKGQIGELNTLGSVASLAGAFVGGWGVTRLGRRRGLLVFGVVQALVVAGYVLAAQGLQSLPYLTFLIVAEHGTGTMATVALFTLMMDVCRPHSAGSDYTLQACVVVVAQLSSRSLSGFIATNLSHTGNFTISAILSLAGALVTAWALARPGFRQRLLAPTGSAW